MPGGFDAQEAALSPHRAGGVAGAAVEAARLGVEAGQLAAPEDPMKVDKGQLTFDNEGLENPGGAFHSRVPHCPGLWSGVTIGRGYDMRDRSAVQVKADLTAAGVEEAVATTLSKGAGLRLRAARSFCRKHKSVEITPEQQNNLFEVVYGEKEAYAKGRIKEWTGTDLEAADPKIQELLVDLFYRGDMTSTKWKRHHFATLVKNNDFKGLLRLLSDRGLWGTIDSNRYEARIQYLEDAAPAR